jgi:hypothetical protein
LKGFFFSFSDRFEFFFFFIRSFEVISEWCTLLQRLNLRWLDFLLPLWDDLNTTRLSATQFEHASFNDVHPIERLHTDESKSWLRAQQALVQSTRAKLRILHTNLPNSQVSVR